MTDSRDNPSIIDTSAPDNRLVRTVGVNADVIDTTITRPKTTALNPGLGVSDAKPNQQEATGVIDPEIIKDACEPIAVWWAKHNETQVADPETLYRATARAKLLGPVPGDVGRALAYVLAGCPDLDYPRIDAAFCRIATFVGTFQSASAIEPPTTAAPDSLTRPTPSATTGAAPSLEAASSSGSEAESAQSPPGTTVQLCFDDAGPEAPGPRPWGYR